MCFRGGEGGGRARVGGWRVMNWSSATNHSKIVQRRTTTANCHMFMALLNTEQSTTPHTESCGSGALTGKRASAAKPNPHQWYRRPLSVWKKMCSGVQILNQVLVCSRGAVKAMYKEHSVV